MSVMSSDWSIKRFITEDFRQRGKETSHKHDKIRSDLCALLIHILRSGTVVELHQL